MRQLLLALPRGVDYLSRAWMGTRGTRDVQDVMNRSEGCICAYGVEGTGKSHLLAIVAEKNPDWLVVDDLDKLDKEGQEKLFHEFTARAGKKIMTASRVPIAQLSHLLPDLKSRLLTGIQVEMRLPDDVELKTMLARAAQARQLMLPVSAVDYILVRAERNPKVLAEILEKLDALSLEEKRAVTVPLVKKVVG